MLKRLRVLLILVPMLFVALFAGCSGSSNNSETGTGPESSKNESQTAAVDPKTRELIIAQAGEPGLDAQQVSGFSAEASILYEPLVVYNEDKTTLLPAAAESISYSEDGKTITVKLPAGTTFTNGDPFTAEALKASFERFLKISPLKSLLSAIAKIEAPDSQTLVITCSTPPGSLLPCLASPISGIVNAKVAADVGDEAFANTPVTYGWGALKEWNKGNYSIFTTYDKFRTNNPQVENKGPLNFDTVRVRYISNNFTRVSELLAGNVDIMTSVPLESLESLKLNNEINVIQESSNKLVFYAVNPYKVTDAKVRTAINLATDREQLKKALQDCVEPVYGPIAPTWVGFSKEAEDKYKNEYGVDFEKAKSLLKEAGYNDADGDGIFEKDGKPLEINLYYFDSLSEAKTIAPVLQALYKEAGIKVNLKEVDKNGFSLAVKNGDYDIAITSGDWVDASYTYLLFAANNYKFMDNSSDKEKVGKLLQEAQSTINMEERVAKYAEASGLIMNYGCLSGLFTTNSYIAVRKNIKGIKYSSDGVISLSDITKE